MPKPVIATHGLGKTYHRLWQGTTVAVQDLTLTVPEGSTFGLLGPNGAGKTTTILMLLGAIRPSSGQFSLMGQGMRDTAVRRRIGYVPERFQLPGYLRAREFLGYQGELYGLGGEALRRRIDEMLKLVGLFERAESPIATFSKGMQQRLALAQALLNDPDLLILDEPTSALDPIGRRDVRVIVEGLRDRGKTVLLNSHILSDIERVCDRVAIMRKGRLERQGSIASLLEGGISLQVRVGGLTPALTEALGHLGTGLRITQQDDIAELALDVSDEARIPLVAEAVSTAGARLYGLIPTRESLEDLFVRVVEEDA
ncbi:MAG TPA: ABC transporter ATP-binding protein [Stenomitos sp.]